MGGAVLFPAVPLVATLLSVAPESLAFRWQHPLLAAPPLHLAPGLYVKKKQLYGAHGAHGEDGGSRR